MSKNQDKNGKIRDSARREFTQDNEFLAFKELYRKVKKLYDLKTAELVTALEDNETIPCSIFSSRLSGLETITKYLREERLMKNTAIATLLNRSEKTIWQAYNSASKKHPTEFDTTSSNFLLPAAIFSNRELSVLENIVLYLKSTYDLSFAEIGRILSRSDRTIWTVYNRAQQKGGKNA